MHDWQEPPDLRRTLKMLGVKHMDIAKSANVHLTTAQGWTSNPWKMRIGAIVTCAKVAKTSATKLVPILGRDFGVQDEDTAALDDDGERDDRHEPAPPAAYYVSAPGFRGDVACLYDAVKILAALKGGTIYQRVWSYDPTMSEADVLAHTPCRCRSCARLLHP